MGQEFKKYRCLYYDYLDSSYDNIEDLWGKIGSGDVFDLLRENPELSLPISGFRDVKINQDYVSEIQEVGNYKLSMSHDLCSEIFGKRELLLEKKENDENGKKVILKKNLNQIKMSNNNTYLIVSEQ